MNVARKDTPAQSSILPQKSQTPPPQRLSSSLRKVKEQKSPCDLYPGTVVQINSQREILQKYNEKLGVVAWVIYSRDRDRSIIYVQFEDACPTFWYSELKAVAAPQATKEGVQPCQ